MVGRRFGHQAPRHLQNTPMAPSITQIQILWEASAALSRRYLSRVSFQNSSAESFSLWMALCLVYWSLKDSDRNRWIQSSAILMFVFGLWWCIVWLARLRFLISFVAIFTAACLPIVINDQNGRELREQSQKNRMFDAWFEAASSMWAFFVSAARTVCLRSSKVLRERKSIHVSQHNCSLCSGSHKWCPHSARTNRDWPIALIYPSRRLQRGSSVSHAKRS